MITIPTRDLCGILADVLPFAGPNDFPLLHAVRIHWDGTALHAQATDQYRIGWSTWNPDDQPAEDGLWTAWGGADDGWHIIIPLADAKDLLAMFKLGPKEWAVPLTVDVFDGRITVERARETGHSALTATINAISADHGVFPDVEEQLAKMAADAAPAGQVVYTAKLLADFAKVRVHGPMLMRSAGKATLVRIGSRFRGAIAQALHSDGKSQGDTVDETEG